MAAGCIKLEVLVEPSGDPSDLCNSLIFHCFDDLLRSSIVADNRSRVKNNCLYSRGNEMLPVVFDNALRKQPTAPPDL